MRKGLFAALACGVCALGAASPAAAGIGDDPTGTFECVEKKQTITVVADGPPERRNRHWSHWEPSSAFRIAVTAKRSSSTR